MRIRAANRDYERWLAGELRGGIVEADLKKKHKKMRESAFAFLRATYWRWAETILDVCPDLADAPARVCQPSSAPTSGTKSLRRPRRGPGWIASP